MLSYDTKKMKIKMNKKLYINFFDSFAFLVINLQTSLLLFKKKN